MAPGYVSLDQVSHDLIQVGLYDESPLADHIAHDFMRVHDPIPGERLRESFLDLRVTASPIS